MAQSKKDSVPETQPDITEKKNKKGQSYTASYFVNIYVAICIMPSERGLVHKLSCLRFL